MCFTSPRVCDPSNNTHVGLTESVPPLGHSQDEDCNAESAIHSGFREISALGLSDLLLSGRVSHRQRHHSRLRAGGRSARCERFGPQ